MVWQTFCQTIILWSVSMAVMQFLGLIFGFVFSFWPVVVLAPLAWRRGKALRAMQASWLILCVGWILARYVDSVPSLLIPEPWNAILFFMAGFILFVWQTFKKGREQNTIYNIVKKARTPQDLLDISPVQFEKMVLELYSLHGYKATRTGKNGDHGVDVVVQTPRGEKWIVQCKRWRGAVGEPVIKEFFGAMYNEKADRGVLITTGTFTPRGSEWAQGKPLVLVDGDQFLSTWKREKGIPS